MAEGARKVVVGEALLVGGDLLRRILRRRIQRMNLDCSIKILFFDQDQTRDGESLLRGGREEN